MTILLFVLCELGLEAWLPLSLSLLVGVDLASSKKVIEGDAGIRFARSRTVGATIARTINR